MPTLNRLRQNADDANAALRDATDRLGLARQRRRESIAKLSALEADTIEVDIDPADITAATNERDAARAALATIEAELKPDRRPRDLPPAVGS